MPQLNLEPIYLSQIKAIVKQWQPELEVWAYGSRVNGTSHEASDLDLVVRNPNNLDNPIDNVSEIRQLFRESDLPFLVDVMDWACLSENFHKEIIKQYVIV